MPRQAAFVDDPSFGALQAAQDQVISRVQAAAVGIDRHVIANRVRNSSWQIVGPHVVVLHSGPLSGNQRHWAAVLHAGDDSALFGLTALEAAGLRGFETPVAHVVAPHGRGRRDLDEGPVLIAVHESVHLAAGALHPVAAPRRQRVARAAVDAASTAATDAACRAVLAAAVQQRLTRAADLRRHPAENPTLARRRLIRETIADVAGGSHSLPELEWNTGLRLIGLPVPTRQRIVRHPGGHYYLDADFDPWLVSVEINGAQHLDLLVREADDVRRFQLTVGGRLVVDLGSYLVRHDNDRAMLRTAQALQSRGWQPERTVSARLQRVADRHGEPLWLPAPLRASA